MATVYRPSKDNELFYEIMRETVLHDLNKDLNINSGNEKKENRKGRKNTSLNSEKAQKENSNRTRVSEKKVAEESGKSAREPLKVLNTNENPGKDSTLAKDNSCPHGMKGSIKKETSSTPKVHSYKVRAREDLNKGKVVRGVPTSWEGSKALRLSCRRSLTQIKPKGSKPVSSPRVKKNRYSMNDLTSIKTEKGKKDTSELVPSLGNPKKAEIEEVFAKMEAIFVNVDPEYLKSQCTRLKGSIPEIVDHVLMKEKTGELPTRGEYLRRLEVERIQNKYLVNFSVEKFLKIIPDPWDYFLNKTRKNCVRYSEHSFYYLKNKYKKHYAQTIQEALLRNEHSLYLTNKELKKKSRSLKMRATNRSKSECAAGKPTTVDVQFVHEVAFIENEEKIKKHLRKWEAKYKKFTEAQKAGTLLECHSCYDRSLLSDDAVNCPANHVLCKDCLVKYVEAEMGKENFLFKCPVKCEEILPIEMLKEVLNPLIVDKINEKLQPGEMKSVEIQDSVSCPFCNSVSKMPPETAVLECQNPSCLMRSCRYCKQSDHVPLRCDELKKLNNTIHEEPTKVSPIKCRHCQKELHGGESDSEKFVCSCGGTMCCICKQPFSDCSHFKTEPDADNFHELSSNSSDFGEAVGNVVEEDREGTPESKYFDSAGNFSDLTLTDSNSV